MKKFIKSNYLGIITFIIALIARFIFIKTRSLDGDEGVILNMVNQPLINLWRTNSIDVHPLFYNLLTWISIRVFGISEFSLRFIPALAGSFSAWAVFIIGRDFFNKKIAFMAGILTALSPYLLYFSQENRMYSLFILLFLISLLNLIHFIIYAKKKNIYLWSIVSLLAALTHHLGLLIWVIELGLLILFRRKEIVKNHIAILIGIILYLPFVGKTIYQFSGRMGEAAEYSLKTNLVGILNAIYRFIAGRANLGLDSSPSYYINWMRTEPAQFLLFIISFILPLTLIIIGFNKLYPSKKKIYITLIVISATAILTAILSGEIGSRSTRYLSFLAPLYFIIIAVGLDKIKKFPRITALVLLAIIYFFGLRAHYLRDAKSVGASDVAKYIIKNADQNDLVLARGAFLQGESTVLHYYLTKNNYSKNISIRDFFGNYKPGNIVQLQNQNTNEVINNYLKDYRKVWYYDFSYSKPPENGKTINLGKDKEGKDMVIYEFQS